MAKNDIDINISVLKEAIRNSDRIADSKHTEILALAGLSLLHQLLLDIHQIAQK